jgi:catechol 2,3-dioxygenase-like lactoylglutathione lyase family enzyme
MRMVSKINHVTFDCADAYALAKFWEQVTGFKEHPDYPNLPGEEECLIRADDGSAGLLFIQVPEKKSVKNRLHLDLQPDTTRDEEVRRLSAIGATVVDDRRIPDGRGWVVMTDPEGNEFCVERSAAERAAQP